VYLGFRHAVGDEKSKNSRQEARKGKKDSGLMGAQRGQNFYHNTGSVSRPIWSSGEPI
jgi:hypothetical protein